MHYSQDIEGFYNHKNKLDQSIEDLILLRRK